MENKNTMFGNEVSKKIVDRDARIREQSATFLADHDKKVKALTEGAEQARLDAAMSNARFGYAATAKRSNDRVRNMNEYIQYENNAATYGMTEMVAEVVENALLLDEAELVKLIPDYKEDIRDVISGILKEGKVNPDITDTRTLALMEYVAKKLPSAKEGKSLTEDELRGIIAAEQPVDIDMSIRNLGTNVSERVASLLEKEQKQKKAVEDEVEKAKKGGKGKAGEDQLAEIEEAIANGELTQQDIDDLFKSGEITENEHAQLSELIAQAAEGLGAEDPNAVPPEGEVPAQEDPNAVPPEGELPPEEGAPVDPNAVPAEDPNAVPPQGMPVDPAMGGAPVPGPLPMKKQVQMLPDGTMNINIYEQFLMEAADSSLIKQSQMSNGYSFTKQGRYDPEMLTAKGLGAIKSTLGLELAMLVTFGLTGIPASIRQNNNLERINSDQYKELREYCHKDPKCAAILKQIKAELYESHPNGKKLKALKKEFFAALKEAKEKFKSEQLKEEANVLLTRMALEERELVGNTLVAETPCTGLFESLAVNEGRKLINEGKEYDPDLCLAKAVMYVTITEALDELGLINVTENDYNRIITEAGGCCNPKGRKTVKAKLKGDSKKMPAKSEKGVVVKESAVLNEFVVTSGPIMNRYSSDDLSERIRKKRRLQESGVDTSNTGDTLLD